MESWVTRDSQPAHAHTHTHTHKNTSKPSQSVSQAAPLTPKVCTNGKNFSLYADAAVVGLIINPVNLFSPICRSAVRRNWALSGHGAAGPEGNGRLCKSLVCRAPICSAASRSDDGCVEMCCFGAGRGLGPVLRSCR